MPLFFGNGSRKASRFSIMLGIPTICGAMALLTSQIPIADLSSISISFIGAANLILRCLRINTLFFKVCI